MLPKEDHRTVGVPQVGGSRIEEVGMSSFNAELPTLSVYMSMIPGNSSLCGTRHVLERDPAGRARNFCLFTP